MKYLELLAVGCIVLNIIIFFPLGIPILIFCMTLLYLMNTVEFHFRSLVSKNFVHFACQFLIYFAKTNANTSRTTGLN